MKFFCLSYLDDKKFEIMSESEREIFIKECFAYDNVLRKNGHFVRLEALQSASNAKPCATETVKRLSSMALTLKPKSK